MRKIFCSLFLVFAFCLLFSTAEAGPVFITTGVIPTQFKIMAGDIALNGQGNYDFVWLNTGTPDGIYSISFLLNSIPVTLTANVKNGVATWVAPPSWLIQNGPKIISQGTLDGATVPEPGSIILFFTGVSLLLLLKFKNQLSNTFAFQYVGQRIDRLVTADRERQIRMKRRVVSWLRDRGREEEAMERERIWNLRE